MNAGTHASSDYCCVRCRAALVVTELSLTCQSCAQSYPLIAGIPVLTGHPAALLTASMAAVEHARSQALRLAVDPGDASPADHRNAAPNAARASRVARATAHDAALVARFMEPVAAYLDRSGQRHMTPLDWIAAHAGGWPGHVSLAMFYQDWGYSRAASAVTSLLLDALLQHRHDAEAVAVVGSGAGGMLHACAPHFSVSYGVDLSIPTTLIAQGMLRGESVTVHVKDAEWRSIRVDGAATLDERIRLVVADAAALPFEDGALSAVISQYLMDLVGDPLIVAAEIGRVLKPGGVWIDFSMPFSLPDDSPALGPVTLDELPALLHPVGLTVTMRERRSFTFLDVTDLDPHGKRTSQPVHFFAAHRTQAMPQPSSSTPPDAAALGEEWWHGIPRLRPGREVHVMRTSAFGASGRRDSVEVGAGAGVATVPATLARVLEDLFTLIDGHRTLREVFDAASAQGLAMAAEGFAEMFVYLSRHYGLVTIDRRSR